MQKYRNNTIGENNLTTKISKQTISRHNKNSINFWN